MNRTGQKTETKCLKSAFKIFVLKRRKTNERKMMARAGTKRAILLLPWRLKAWGRSDIPAMHMKTGQRRLRGKPPDTRKKRR